MPWQGAGNDPLPKVSCALWASFCGAFVGAAYFDLIIADQEFLVCRGRRAAGIPRPCARSQGREATEGDILIDRTRVNDRAPKDRDVAMEFQPCALYSNMNVYERIRFPLKVRGIDPRSHVTG